jgi:hypothetical protein
MAIYTANYHLFYNTNIRNAVIKADNSLKKAHYIVGCLPHLNQDMLLNFPAQKTHSKVSYIRTITYFPIL